MTRAASIGHRLALLSALVVAPLAARASGPALQLVETTVSRTRLAAGDGVVVKVKVKNVGTETAHDVTTSLNGSDHFNFFGPMCAHRPGECSGCWLGDLDPGETGEATFGAEVCCFPQGETRAAFLFVEAHYSELGSGDPPRAQLPIWITGPHD